MMQVQNMQSASPFWNAGGHFLVTGNSSPCPDNGDDIDIVVATPLPSTSSSTSSRGKPTMEEVMDELQSRFLMNLPQSELASSERLFFQIEQCYWFYEDFYADHHNHLTHLKLNDFARKMFNHCVLLQPLKQQCESMFQDFKTYQSQIPVVGCILLNPAKTKLVLVRNWKGTSWSLPRGKVNQGETDLDCARREVFEECGYDTSTIVSADGVGINAKDFIEFHVNQQRIRMYIVTNVPEEFNFAPQTRKEISLIQWFEFDELPKKTWGVLPFMSRLRRWITNEAKKATNTKKKSSRSNTPVKNRSVSAPRNRPGHTGKPVAPASPPTTPPLPKTHVVASNPHLQHMASSRSMSTPHARPKAKTLQSRGHFGTERQSSTSLDHVNAETFGALSNATFSFNVDEMFRVNEQLTGATFSYDGNPHDFGKVTPKRADIQTRLLASPHPVHANGIVNGRLGNLSPPTAASSSTVADHSPTTNSVFAAFAFDTVDIMACVK
ncbi:hypothetical protein H310_00659 [Aphanomyces invadans]|uniref:Nudix hydrolase domain-containing protein n=1 Tax=Aphanomyces invadans TaxID=157072 RepID=A0A024UXD0_9STRA|nr:hypothetical protein H310_00659 [Aphanomyces invadans]ETW10333.1 hypothetical protein H310_00659 [Aphanomyces invadans]|eukprot:XP_008861744.1 hypothetical protein H310_00659 [Aphanomyces invadans]